MKKLSYWIGGWWRWSRGPGLKRKAVGFGLPFLAALILLAGLTSPEEESSLSLDANLIENTPRVEAQATATATPTSTPAPTEVTPTETPEPALYTVQSGDTLGVICAEALPSLPVDDCISQVVAANELSSPADIFIDQVLTLPSTPGTQSSSAPPTSAGVAGSSPPTNTDSAEAPAPTAQSIIQPTTEPTTPPAAVEVLPTATPIPPTATPIPPPPEPTTPPAAPVGGQLVTSITSPIARGATAFLTASTNPGASCSISYTTPSDNQSEAQGLVNTTADGAGNVAWSWVISTRTNPGTGSVQVNCGGVSETVSIVIQ